MLKFLKFALLLAVIISATIGGTVFFLSKQGAPLAQLTGLDAAASADSAPDPIFAELDPFTVTLRGEYRNRILYVAITLRLADQPSRKIISDYMPEVRDRILKVLTSQDNNQVQTVEGREALVNTLKSRLQAPFAPQPSGPHIDDVLFTAFVVQ